MAGGAEYLYIHQGLALVPGQLSRAPAKQIHVGRGILDLFTHRILNTFDPVRHSLPGGLYLFSRCLAGSP